VLLKVSTLDARRRRRLFMEMPQHDSQDPEQNIPETPRPSAKPRISKRRALVYRYGVPAFAVLLLTILMSFVVINVARGMNHVNVQEKPISVVLNMADQHQLKSVSLNGDDVNAIGTNGQHYHALKEDGQSVTELFRRDG